MPPARAPISLALIFLCSLAWAQEPACPTPAARATPEQETPPKPTLPDTPVEVRAQRLQVTPDGLAELEGEAEIIRGGDRIGAERLHFDRATEEVSTETPVEYQNSLGDRFRTEHLRLNLDSGVGEAGPSDYSLRHELARGDAARIEFLGPDHTRLTDLRYTTCSGAQDDWFLNIAQLDLDNAEEIATARHATVDFLGVPIFYFPYVNLPITNRRKSGFLFPRVGHSDQRGYELGAPYYLNLAPNYDATLTPNILSRRGLQLQNEFRYLTRDGTGTISLDVLPDDRVTHEDRVLSVLQHHHTLSPLWSANLDLRRASDQDYFEDFGDRLDVASTSYLPQSADLSYSGRIWSFSARASDHQTIDRSISSAQEPYARLPQLALARTAPRRPNTLTPHFEAEWNRFQHPDPEKLDGERTNLNLGVSLPMQATWGFLTPKLGARYIGYRLEREQLDPGADDTSPSLVRGVFSLDSGLFFERDATWSNHRAIQTFEPRLFYLRIPTKDQDDLPNFDTALPDLTFDALFRENRFNGGDRIGDANQLTAAVTTRFLDTEDGIERLTLSLGRIYYYDDLEVNVPAGTESHPASDIVAEASAWLIGNWYARQTVQWNADDERAERSSTYLQYQPASDRILSVGQTYIRDQLGQTDVSGEWPLNPRWRVRGRSLYSTREERNLETFLGIEYNACCWALRVTGSRRWQGSEQVNAIALELELNGLSKFGSSPDSRLKDGLFFPYEDTSRSVFYE